MGPSHAGLDGSRPPFSSIDMSSSFLVSSTASLLSESASASSSSPSWACLAMARNSALASATLIISAWRCSCKPGMMAYDKALTNFFMNSVDDLRRVYVSSPTDVSKSTRQRPNDPVASANDAHAAPAISAASSSESGSSVAVSVRPVDATLSWKFMRGSTVVTTDCLICITPTGANAAAQHGSNARCAAMRWPLILRCLFLFGWLLDRVFVGVGLLLSRL
mmetsp:Transcript_17431/g.48310  ORF Transcript_17431/g.48310 Transcript_17431/m.48310 type:complete len:221 (-) Transcript_17431:65-727(-)